MKYIQITIKTTQEFAEMATYLLMENGAEGASVTDKQDYINLINNHQTWDYIDDNFLDKYDNFVYIKTCFKQNQKNQIETFKNAVNQSLQFFDNAICEIHTDIVEDKNWNTEWKKFYQPLTFGNLVINPKWIKAAYKDKTVINIDPSMAFGTGQHESTSNCLNLVQELQLNNKTVVDLGCGSGILGMSALKLGAENCLFVDIDSQAMKVCEKNCKLNKLKNCEFLVADNINNVNQQFDVILANLTVDLLTMYSYNIKRVLKDNGELSGIIHGRENEIISVFEKLDIKSIKHLQKGDWHSYLCRN